MKKKQKTLFFKVVQENGQSVHAWRCPKLGRKYETGKTYNFPINLPAHGFLKKNDSFRTLVEFAPELYAHDSSGNTSRKRILICLGYGSEKEVSICHIIDLYEYGNDIHKDKAVRYAYLYEHKLVFASHRFTVIGELCARIPI